MTLESYLYQVRYLVLDLAVWYDLYFVDKVLLIDYSSLFERDVQVNICAVFGP